MSDEYFLQNGQSLKTAVDIATSPVKSYSADPRFSSKWWQVQQQDIAELQRRKAAAAEQALKDAAKAQQEYFARVRAANATPQPLGADVLEWDEMLHAYRRRSTAGGGSPK